VRKIKLLRPGESLPGSDEAAAALRAVEREAVDLERLCGELEKSLVAGDWNGVANALRSSRRTTHAFLNAMDAAAPYRNEAFDRTINARMRRVFDVREDQLTRLQAFNGDVGERLKTLARWKAYASSIGSKRAPARTAGFDKTQ
jgi:hypothetical protein